MGDIANTLEYHSFRSTIPLKKIVVDDDHHKAWSLYDAGPRSVRCPLIFFPPASGTADVFFKQILALSTVGYRVIAVDYPVYWTLKEICEGFQKLLDHLQLDKVHIFGASLGGFIAQKFAEHTSHSPRVMSLLVCNSFNDTSIFQQTNAAPTFWMMPALFLKKMVIGSFQKGMVDSSIADSIDFLVDKLDGLSQKVLASRLTLNCMSSYVEPQKLSSVDITIMDVFDECALSQMVKDEMYKCYPDAKRAHLKSGGNFPYLSRSLEVNVFIKVHLQKYEGTKFSAKEESEPDDLIKINNKAVYHNNKNEEDTKSNDLNEGDTKSYDLNEEDTKSSVLNEEDTTANVLKEEDTKSSVLDEDDTKSSVLDDEGAKSNFLNEEETANVLNEEETANVLNEEETANVLNEEETANVLNEEETVNVLDEEGTKSNVLDDEGAKSNVLDEDTKSSVLNEDTTSNVLDDEGTKSSEPNEDTKSSELKEDTTSNVSNEEDTKSNDLKTNDLNEQELPVNNNNADQNSIHEIPKNSLDHSDTES